MGSRHAIRVIKSAYLGLCGSNCRSLNSLQCVVFANIDVSQNRLQIPEKNGFRFNSIFKKNSISISDSIIVTSVKNYAFLVYMYYMHSGYRTSIFVKNCTYYIQIFTVTAYLAKTFSYSVQFSKKSTLRVY